MRYTTYSIGIKGADEIREIAIAQGWDEVFEDWVNHDSEVGAGPVMDEDSFAFYAGVIDRVNEVAEIEERLIEAGVDTSKIWPKEVRDVDRDTQEMLEAYRKAWNEREEQ